MDKCFILNQEVIRGDLSVADAYVFPSWQEDFPVAPIEAMAYGLPVVAADAPGVADILEGGEAAGGFLETRGDAGRHASALGIGCFDKVANSQGEPIG